MADRYGIDMAQVVRARNLGERNRLMKLSRSEEEREIGQRNTLNEMFREALGAPEVAPYADPGQYQNALTEAAGWTPPGMETVRGRMEEKAMRGGNFEQMQTIREAFSKMSEQEKKITDKNLEGMKAAGLILMRDALAMQEQGIPANIIAAKMQPRQDKITDQYGMERTPFSIDNLAMAIEELEATKSMLWLTGERSGGKKGGRGGKLTPATRITNVRQTWRDFISYNQEQPPTEKEKYAEAQRLIKENPDIAREVRTIVKKYGEKRKQKVIRYDARGNRLND